MCKFTPILTSYFIRCVFSIEKHLKEKKKRIPGRTGIPAFLFYFNIRSCQLSNFSLLSIGGSPFVTPAYVHTYAHTCRHTYILIFLYMNSVHEFLRMSHPFNFPCRCSLIHPFVSLYFTLHLFFPETHFNVQCFLFS